MHFQKFKIEQQMKFREAIFISSQTSWAIIHLQCLLSTGIDRTVESNVVKPTSVIINETAIWWMLFNIRGRICAVAGQHLPTVAQLATS
ncbi:putative peptidase, M20D family [Trichinella spiralis]|uniref:putative peptidase, M20D family n=1 Tax=Trichinella spiralis TaxID=6334 RepID=UPI0001EFE0B9|nr:putative peptidase, M20D family [Trichinella spiralis]